MSQDTPDPEFLVARQDGMVVRLKSSIYDEETVAKAAHRFTDRCFVHLERESNESVLCRIVPKRAGDDVRGLSGEFVNTMLDQALRSRLALETEPVRRLLLAQAFSRTNILHPDLDTVDPATDPRNVGAPDPPRE